MPLSRVVIYTACFGPNQTALLEPIGQIPPHVELLAFTDNPPPPGNPTAWNIRGARGQFANPRMSAKWYRMSSTFLFPDADVTVWVDASMQINVSAILDTIAKQFFEGRDGVVACMFHPERNNIRDEAAASMEMVKYHGEPINDQVAIYFADGLPEAHGLWATGILIRGNNPTVTTFNSFWMHECVLWSYQDQLSLPYVCWKLGITPKVIPGNIYNTPLIAQRMWTGPSDVQQAQTGATGIPLPAPLPPPPPPRVYTIDETQFDLLDSLLAAVAEGVWVTRVRDTLEFAVNASDVFSPGCAEAAAIETQADVEMLEACKEELPEHWQTLYACRKEKSRPFYLHYKFYDAKACALFDACGPARRGHADFVDPDAPPSVTPIFAIDSYQCKECDLYFTAAEVKATKEAFPNGRFESYMCSACCEKKLPKPKAKTKRKSKH